MSAEQSKYVERRGYLSRYTHERTVALREKQAGGNSRNQELEWVGAAREHLPRFVPFLISKCGVDFAGRILEIGAGCAWLSAELSKVPKVVEIVTTDYSGIFLREQAPKVFALLGANRTKIIRMPADFHQLDFPENHFDFVVSSAALSEATNIVQVLREVKRVLKPGGRFVAIREPVWPLLKIQSRSKTVEGLVTRGINERLFTMSSYREFFKQAGLPLEVKRVNISRGFKYFFDAMVNGLTHARYAFIGRKKSEPRPLYGGKARGQRGLPPVAVRGHRPFRTRAG